MKSKPTHADLAGSRYLALQRLARAQKRTTAELLQLYVLESFLRRLVRSRHDHTLVLKGGMLLAAFGLRRATRDVDVLALKSDNDPTAVQRLIVDVTSVEADDGVEFLQDTITAAVIRDDDVYPGVRASLEARLATARLKLGVDFNVGDPVIPAPIRTAVPVLLGDEPIEVLSYPKVMVVAEKLVTALQRGRASTRWRDFADLFMLVPGDLVESEIIEALRAVAKYRGVPLQPLGKVLDGMPNEAQARWAVARATGRAGPCTRGLRDRAGCARRAHASVALEGDRVARLLSPPAAPRSPSRFSARGLTPSGRRITTATR